MKIKDAYKIINSSVKEFNNDFNHNVKYQKYSKKYIHNLMEKYSEWSMVESSYCCFGLETCCWQDLYEEDIWDYTLDDVKNIIIDSLKGNSKYLKRHKRFYVEENENEVNIFVVLRDTKCKCNYNITGYNEKI